MTTPEPWEELEKKAIRDFTNEVAMQLISSNDTMYAVRAFRKELPRFITSIRTAAYEQGKREGETAKDEAVREAIDECNREKIEYWNRETDRLARTDLLTALKSVLGEELNFDANNPDNRVWLKGYGHLHDRLARFIKEQEEI